MKSKTAGIVLTVMVSCLIAISVEAQQPSTRTRRSQRVVPLPRFDVASPNGQVRFRLLENPERLTFGVSLQNVIAVEPSAIQFELDGYDLSSGVILKTEERSSFDEFYPWYGGARASAQWNRLQLGFEHDLSQTEYFLEICAFNDGVAYRHVVPGGDVVSRVPDERSTFVLPAGAIVWYAGLAAGHYEDTYKSQNIADVQAGEWSGPPLTFKLPGAAGYGSITEANLVNYSGMGLESDGRRGWIIGLGHRHPLNYPFELRYGREEAKRLGKPASVTGPITTPWRVIMLGRDLNTLVNSFILPSLCPPPDPQLFPRAAATDWIKPGRAVWRYLDGGAGGTEGMKEFSRLASQLGFEYHVIEGFWSRWNQQERKEVIDFSSAQNVGIWLWRHSRDLRTPEARDEFFQMVHQLGATGVKIDFLDHEHKEIIDLYEALLRKAAEHKILINFHGANKPTGRERTWPNDMVREAVKGLEARSLRDRARHQTILPFTRRLAGPSDYTTLIFSERRGDTSWAHQIASLAIFDSPLLTVAAHPQGLLDHPALDVIRSVPAVWNETIVLPMSEIGQLAAFARRRNRIWFLAVMCGPEPRSIRVPLNFLSADRYAAVLVRDGSADASVTLERLTADPAHILTLDLAAGGGFVARFTPASEFHPPK